MKPLFIFLVSVTLLSANTWQDIQSPIETATLLNVQSGSLERTVLEFNIEGFHLLPIDKMNDNQYGLSSGVYTKDLGRGLRVSKAIRAGITFVNTYRLISPSAPFGGMKDSGYGKEAGIESIKDYTRIKTTWFNTSEKPMSDPFTMG